MKYLCLGYHDEQAWTAMSDADRKTLVDQTLAYREMLIAEGHCLADQGLHGARTAATLRFDASGKVTVTDGPFAETKEQLGGVMVLEARDLNDAIRLMSRLPCMRIGGSLEIRPINEEIAG